MVKLYGKPLRVNKAAQERNTQEVGANLFIGGLDPDVDEKVSMGRGASESGELLLGVALGSCSWELPLRVALGRCSWGGSCSWEGLGESVCFWLRCLLTAPGHHARVPKLPAPPPPPCHAMNLYCPPLPVCCSCCTTPSPPLE